jgi:hypothetical protein
MTGLIRRQPKGRGLLPRLSLEFFRVCVASDADLGPFMRSIVGA